MAKLEDHQRLPMGRWERLNNWSLGIDCCVAAEFLTQYFISAVARILTPGCEARCNPVLVEPLGRKDSRISQKIVVCVAKRPGE